MKKTKYLLLVAAMAFIFTPIMNVFAMGDEEKMISEITVNCSKSSVTLGETLSEYTVSTTTEGVSIEAYGENTGWSYTPKDSNNWGNLEDGALASSEDNHYGLRLKLDKEDNYLFDGDLTIIFNGEEYSYGYIYLDATAYYWTLYIDLGVPTSGDTTEPDDNNDDDESSEVEETKTYSVKDDAFDGISIAFDDANNKEFTFRVSSLTESYSEDYLNKECGESADCRSSMLTALDAVKESVSDLTKDIGSYIELYGFHLSEVGGDDVHEGEFRIKIKMTPEMKKFKSFKLVYFSNVNPNGCEVSDEVIDLEVDGDYLVGDLEHLSAYALVGVGNNTPSTGDNAIFFMIIAMMSVFGLVTARKLKEQN